MVDAQDTIMFQNSAVGVFSHQEQASFTFVAATKKITRGTGDFTTDFKVDQFITAEDSASNDARVFRILSVSALELVLDVAPVDDGPSSITLRAFDLVGLNVSYSGPEQTNPEVDVSHSLSTAREFKAGLLDNGTFSFQANLVRGDLGLKTVKTMAANRTTSEFLVAYSDRDAFKRFSGSIASIGEEGSIDGAISIPVSVRVSGAIIDSELF